MARPNNASSMSLEAETPNITVSCSNLSRLTPRPARPYRTDAKARRSRVTASKAALIAAALVCANWM